MTPRSGGSSLQFANTDLAEPGIEFVTERGQQRPADWPRDFVPLEQLAPPRPAPPHAMNETVNARWVPVGRVCDFPSDGGRAVKCGRSQIAVFRFASRGQWYACQNLCPHKQEMVLSRGIIGDSQGLPKVACPLHKKTFSLESGECTSGDSYQIKVYPVKVEAETVFLALAPEEADVASLDSIDVSCATQCTVGCG